jgi:hypothetical protein
MDRASARMMVICPFCAESIVVSMPPDQKPFPLYGVWALLLPILGAGIFLMVRAYLSGAPEDLDFLIIASLVLVMTLLAGLSLAVLSFRRERLVLLPLLGLVLSLAVPLVLWWQVY